MQLSLAAAAAAAAGYASPFATTIPTGYHLAPGLFVFSPFIFNLEDIRLMKHLKFKRVTHFCPTLQENIYLSKL